MPAQPATPIDSPLVASVIRNHEQVTDQPANVGAGHRMGATADTCHFKGVGIECVEYGPGFIPIWPMVDECIAVEQIVTATQVLALTAADLVTK
jgi:acetylornithine deacetylase/succinyl-diaminopimelate desuccinylase-like protein